MNYRLGEYVCSACEHTEPTAPQWAQQQDLPPAADAVPGGAADFNLPPDPAVAPGSPYSLAPSRASLPRRQSTCTAPVVDLLHQEKALFIKIYLAYLALMLGLSSAMLPAISKLLQDAALQAGVSGLELSGQDIAMVANVLFALALASLLFGALANCWALYGAPLWIKWGCLGNLSLSVLQALFGFIQLAFMGSVLSSALGPRAGPLQVAAVAMAVLSLAWQCWFGALLYRVIRQWQRP